MANPQGNHQEPSHASSTFNGNGNIAAAAAVTAAPESSGTTSAMKHNPGISMDWTTDEQAALEEGLAKFGSENKVICYAKIALQLQNKTVRDVALRCRWMSKKENSKRRKEEHNLNRKSKDKKERVADPSSKSSQFAARPNVAPYMPPAIPMDNDDGIPYEAIAGPAADLLEQNTQTFNQISANFSTLKIHDNIGLFCQARDNIDRVMNDLSNQLEMMKQMPPLPVKVNEELANTILPRTALPPQS
ncbi:uncharacterized protein LOC115739972 isoform X1 [Rhodamnia argentea]|uniref:Uncharacterized protein LOC115739972 isoform X1 n=1 Tax=Rhodamnia argentea TaxID=178133 RepID=A0ABM3HFT3_9MYRT|nr:uncharacterized protein LOC115739972 isoform X1 [Rhodamnia argentea]